MENDMTIINYGIISSNLPFTEEAKQRLAESNIDADLLQCLGEDELYLENWYGSSIEDDLQFMTNALAPLGYVFNGDIHYYGDYDGKVYIKDNVVTCVDEEDIGLYEAGDETLIQMLKERGYTVLKNGIEV